ncbi:MAG: hypothetical protein RMJ97_05980 [Raineya sp.]|nr:hypothetical protein [Raineya sp.]
MHLSFGISATLNDQKRGLKQTCWEYENFQSTFKKESPCFLNS